MLPALPAQTLGFRRLHQTKVLGDGPRIWGLLEKVIHLVKIERIHADPALNVGRVGKLVRSLNVPRDPGTHSSP